MKYKELKKRIKIAWAVFRQGGLQLTINDVKSEKSAALTFYGMPEEGDTIQVGNLIATFNKHDTKHHEAK